MGVVEKKLYSHHDPINPRPKDAQLIVSFIYFIFTLQMILECQC